MREYLIDAVAGGETRRYYVRADTPIEAKQIMRLTVAGLKHWIAMWFRGADGCWKNLFGGEAYR